MEDKVINIFEKSPVIENDNFLLRMVMKKDCDNLLEVYSDKNALPFFNSDNCDGDNFYYCSKDRMLEAIDFWNLSYKNGWFVRLAIVDKLILKVIGTIELWLRISEDAFNEMGILRVDVRSEYEKTDKLFEIFSLIISQAYEMLECNGIITKAPIYAVDRIEAIQKLGFRKSEHLLVGKNKGCNYEGYWVIKQ